MERYTAVGQELQRATERARWCVTKLMVQLATAVDLLLIMKQGMQ